MAKTKAYKIEFDPDLNTTKITRVGRVYMGFKLTRANAIQVLKSGVLDSCGVYLLLTDCDDGTRAVYVGEAESVHDRLKQHCTRPPYDWDVAIGFISVNDEWEKSNIKYMEHGLYARLCEAGRYALKNGNTPKQSKVFSPDECDEQIDEIKELVAYLGYPKLFQKKEKKLHHLSSNTSIPAFKAGRLYRAVMPYLFDNHLVTKEDLKELVRPESSKKFKLGGHALLRKDNGSRDILKDNHDRVRYYPHLKLMHGSDIYYLTSQLYDKSVPPLLEWVRERGITDAKLVELYNK